MQQATRQVQPIAPTRLVQELQPVRRSAFEPHPARGYAGNQATLRRLSRTTPHVQCRLEIGAVNDPLEAEADRVADEVMRMPDPGGVSVCPAPTGADAMDGGVGILHRKCAACEEEEEQKLSRKEAGNAAALDGAAAPPIVHEVLSSPGQRLHSQTRAFFEPRFGCDFSQVRVHTDDKAAQTSGQLGALAYTVGQDLVFAPGAYLPAADVGRRLIAHELTHVLQNGRGGAAALRCDTPDAGPTTPQPQPADAGVKAAGPTDAGPTDAGAPNAASGQTPVCPQAIPTCPAEYCEPFPSQQEAEQDRDQKAEGILGDIKLVNGRAEPLFQKFIFDPGPAGDISSTYGPDFANCAVTRDTTLALLQQLQAGLLAHPPTFPPGSDSVTVNITSVMGSKELSTFMCRMVFDDYTTVPGLIAGGVGETQETETVGKDTSGAVNDSRSAAGSITVTRNPDGSFGILPDITYTVVDTLDFCPGNCGGAGAQRLTIPLSRWEASSISGDVPFKVIFSAPSLVGAHDSEEE